MRISEILTGGAKPSKKAAAKTDDKKADDKKAEVKAAAPKKEAAKAEAKGEAKAEASRKALFKAPAGEGDDLTVIKGIGPVAAKDLHAEGITTFAQIAALTDDEIATIDEHMPFSAAQISDWREQAKDLAK